MAEIKKKVLIVEDERPLREILKDKFKASGFLTFGAKDGKEGLSIALKEHPDIILLDIIMPKMDGYQVLGELKKSQKKWIPFIMLSAVTDFKKINQVYDGEADFYLPKPVNPIILSRNIKTLLNLAQYRIR